MKYNGPESSESTQMADNQLIDLPDDF